jgi:hypothetical protein
MGGKSSMKIKAHDSELKKVLIGLGSFLFLVIIFTGGLVRILTATPGGM